MSILIRLWSDSKISEANIFASWVLPTPVCPRKIKDPIGLSGAFKPDLFLWIAFTIFSTAFFCPINFLDILSDKRFNLFFSDLTILVTGMFVIIETTSAIFCSLTVILLFLESSFHLFCASSNSFSTFFSSSRSLAASSYFCFFTTEFFSRRTSSSFFSKSTMFLGTVILLIWTLEPASSKASIALSGKNLSETYLKVNSTHALSASSV